MRTSAVAQVGETALDPRRTAVLTTAAVPRRSDIPDWLESPCFVMQQKEKRRLPLLLCVCEETPVVQATGRNENRRTNQDSLSRKTSRNDVPFMALTAAIHRHCRPPPSHSTGHPDEHFHPSPVPFYTGSKASASAAEAIQPTSGCRRGS